MAGKKCEVCAAVKGCPKCREERDRIMVQVLSALIMHGVHHAEEQVVRHAYKWADVCMRVGKE